MRLGTLLKKELREYWRTYRALALGVMFVVFGLLSPATARYLPDIFARIDMQGIVIQLPPPTVADGNAQFVKNMSQIGTIVLILVAMGAVARERDKGTVAFTLSKPVTRGAFLLAKAVALVFITWTSLGLSALVHWTYTRLLLGPLPFGECMLMAALVGLYLTVILALTFLGSTLTKSLILAGAFGFAGYLGISLAGAIPRLGQHTPNALLGKALAAGNGTLQMTWSGALTGAGIILACWVLSWAWFRKTEL